MALNGVSSTKTQDKRKSGSAEQDQTADMYRLILQYTLRKSNPCSPSAE